MKAKVNLPQRRVRRRLSNNLQRRPRQSSDDDLRPVVGTANHRLVIDRIGTNPGGFLGYAPAELVGRSVLSVVDRQSAPAMLSIFLEAMRTQADVSTTVSVRSKSGRQHRCEIVVVPLLPAPSSVFVLLPGNGASSPPRTPQLVHRVLRGVAPSDVGMRLPSFAQSPAAIHGVAELTSRELEIVIRLVSGDRVHAIASGLFISRSTVRNHLSAVFAKLRVHSQQELVDLFRATASGVADENTATDPSS